MCMFQGERVNSVMPAVPLTRVVWTFDKFGDNFGINLKWTEYLKGSCELRYKQHFSLKYFLKNALVGTIIAN